MDLSPGAEFALAISTVEAKRLGSAELEPDHVFLALLKIGDFLKSDQIAKQVPKLDWDAARPEVVELTEHFSAQGVSRKWMRRRLRTMLGETSEERQDFEGQRSSDCMAMFDDAAQIASDEGDGGIDLPALLNCYLDSNTDAKVELFREFGTDSGALKMGASSGGREAGDPAPTKPLSDDTEPKVELKDSKLARFGRDLTAAARRGEIGPLFGRREECKQIARILNQRTRNNAVLLGDPGVGKTAVVEKLALLAAEENAHEAIRDYHFVEISTAALVAGTMYRGEFEKRLEAIVKEAAKDPNLVLFIDEMHTLIGAGAGSGGSMDAANILKPALARGDIRCVGATTVDEYRKYIEQDAALQRRFEQVWVDEPSQDETLKILTGLRPSMEEHHGLKIPDEIMARTVEYTVRYITESFLPDKAIIVLDQACSRRRLQTLSPTAEVPDAVLRLEDVAETVAARTQVPVEVLLLQEEDQLLHLEEVLEKRVVGQTSAVQTLAKAVRAARSGVKEPGKPIVVLFAGPSGTGKTELAKALAQFLFHDDDRLITLDMTEYRESHSRSKIIGSPPGYVGFDEEPMLIREIRKHPYSVVLLDEIEKAHPEVMTVFMPVFDEGRLTTAHGRKVNFSEAIIVMTSNLGIGPERRRLGVVLEDQVDDEEREAREAKGLEKQVLGAVKNHLRPELLNRVQATVVFQPLSKEAIFIIIDIRFRTLNRRLASQGRDIEISLDESGKEFLVEQGYSTQYGARHLDRAIERWVEQPLADAILAGEIATGAQVRCRREGDELLFDVDGQGGIRTLTLAPGPAETEPIGG